MKRIFGRFTVGRINFSAANAPALGQSWKLPPLHAGGARNLLKRLFERSKTGLAFHSVASFNESTGEAQVAIFRGLFSAAATNAEATSAGEVSSDGILTVPFGDWKVEAIRPDGATFTCIQRLDAEAVAEMTKGWRGVLQALKLWLLKIPIYEGHPDRTQALTEDQKDDLIRGTVRSIGSDGEALIINVSWNPSGKSVRENYQAHSPHWLLRETGETKDGLPVMRPYMLVSIGLTNAPNIAGSAINEEEKNKNQENPQMNELIAKLRAELKLSADMSDEDVLQYAITHYNKAVDELYQIKNQLAEAQRLQKEAEATAEKAKKDLSVAEDAAKDAQATNEAMTTKAIAIVDDAIKAGKIRIADRPGWLARIKTDPIEAVASASNETPKLKVDEMAATAVNATGSRLSPMVQFRAAVNAYMKLNGVKYDEAWQACQATHAALWEAIGKGK